MRGGFGLLKLFVAVLLLTPWMNAQQPLTNAAVIEMTKAGLSDEIIAKSIRDNPGSFQTAPKDLIALKRAGVSDRIISAMMSKSAPEPSGSPMPTSAPVSVDTNPSSSTAKLEPAGIVEAALNSGDLKPARFAKVFFLSVDAAEVKKEILALRESLEAARREARFKAGDAGDAMVDVECLEGLITLRAALITGALKLQTGPVSSRQIDMTDANENGEFRFDAMPDHPFFIVAVGKVGMNGAIWLNESTDRPGDFPVKMSQPLFACYDAEGTF